MYLKCFKHCKYVTPYLCVQAKQQKPMCLRLQLKSYIVSSVLVVLLCGDRPNMSLFVVPNIYTKFYTNLIRLAKLISFS